MKVMYIRCSTIEQNESAQIELSKQIGAEKVFIDKASGKTTDNRPQLKAMLDYVREGDIVYCRDISRIARNVKNLLDIIDTLNKKGVEFVSIKENIDTTIYSLGTDVIAECRGCFGCWKLKKCVINDIE